MWESGTRAPILGRHAGKLQHVGQEQFQGAAVKPFSKIARASVNTWNCCLA